MKVLKSGIEMTKEELNKTKGGLCSCACGIRIGSMNVSVVSEDGNQLCSCGGCSSIDGNSYDTMNGALVQPG